MLGAAARGDDMDATMQKMYKGLRKLINELEQIEKNQVDAIRSA